MLNLIRAAVLLSLAAVVASGCGSSDAAKAEERRPAPDGWMNEVESDRINPALADYNAAALVYNRESSKCSQRASRLHRAKRARPVVVKCHLDQTDALVDSIAAMNTVISDFDREYRETCEHQRVEFLAFLERFERGWQNVHDQWQRYADGGTVSDKNITKLATQAVKLGVEFSNEQIPALSVSCFSPKARAEARENAVKRAKEQAAERAQRAAKAKAAKAAN